MTAATDRSRVSGFRIWPLLWIVGFASCASPKPSGRTLVSVSWYNPGPQALDFAEIRLGKGPPPFLTEKVIAYGETSGSATLALPKYLMAEIRTVVTGTTRPPVFLSVEPPLRSDPQNDYNLRIILQDTLPVLAQLEPATTARARLRNRNGEAP